MLPLDALIFCDFHFSPMPLIDAAAFADMCAFRRWRRRFFCALRIIFIAADLRHADTLPSIYYFR